MADLGSPITIVSDEKYEKNWAHTGLLESDVNPKPFGDFDINMLGFFKDHLNVKGRSIVTNVYVAERGRNIVGWRDLARLGVILKAGATDPIVLGEVLVASIQPESDSFSHHSLDAVLGKYKTLFEDRIGCVKGFEHAIKFKKRCNTHQAQGKASTIIH